MTNADEITAGSDLYRRMLAFDYCDHERAEIMHKVWCVTPWMADVYTGGYSNDQDRELAIREWCREKFGPEAWPIHGKPGTWQRGGATINGWTWMGFQTEAMMMEFLQAWPSEEVTR